MLLIDEVDRVEIETEALLLEILSEYQVSIPELGTVVANQIPLVFLTSNNTRELSEALKRRCLYLHIDYPQMDREKEIVLTKVPGITENLADQIARIVRSHPPDRPEEVAVGVARRSTGPARSCCSGSNTSTRRQAKETLHILLKYQSRHRQGRQRTLGRREVRSISCSISSPGSSPNCERQGCRCSLTENLDAMEAITHIPLEDRDTFKYALGATLVKNSSHWRAVRDRVRGVLSAARPAVRSSKEDADADEFWREMQETMREAGSSARRRWGRWTG